MIYGNRGLAMFAISGVEIALWDLARQGPAAFPVCELLGGAGPHRGSPPTRASSATTPPPRWGRACRPLSEPRASAMLKLHQTDVESVRAAPRSRRRQEWS